MRALIASACVAVLAFVGYYFWSEFDAHRTNRAMLAEAERAAVSKMRAAEADAMAASGECTRIATALVESGGNLSVADRSKAATCAMSRTTGVYVQTTLARFQIAPLD